MKILFVLILSMITFSSPDQITGLEVPSVDKANRWELLGKRKVNRTLDRDIIPVTILEGRFSKIKLKVKRSPLKIHRVAVHYGNGDVEEVAIRKVIGAGGETRVIDLPGRKRTIKKIALWYDSIGPRKATVQVWGRH